MICWSPHMGESNKEENAWQRWDGGKECFPEDKVPFITFPTDVQIKITAGMSAETE